MENDKDIKTGAACQTCVPLLVDVACQTDDTIEDLVKMEELQQLRQEYQHLKTDNSPKTDASFSVDVLQTDEQRLRFYTG